MHHTIKVQDMHFKMIERGLLPFWIVNCLEADVQVGQVVCFEHEAGRHVEASVSYVTNRHQHINHIVFGFSVVQLSESERMSISMCDSQLRASLQVPKLTRERCANQEDYERKLEIQTILEKNKSDRLPLKTRKHLNELKLELKEIDTRFHSQTGPDNE